LGDVGNVAVETEALLIQHGISYEPFSPAVNACLPVNWAITEDDLLRRHIRLAKLSDALCRLQSFVIGRTSATGESSPLTRQRALILTMRSILWFFQTAILS